MTQLMPPTKVATNALTDLVTSARHIGEEWTAQGSVRASYVHALEGLASTLDAARTRLVQDGESYLDVAWAMIDAGRRLVAELIYLVNVEQLHARA